MTSTQLPFVVTACDRHGRSPSGEVLIAGRLFQSEKGFPGLRYGCGGENFTPLPSADRWLVLQPGSPADFAILDGGIRVFKAQIELDGTKDEVLKFLEQSRARSLPYYGKRVQGGAGLLAVGGVDSDLECTSDAARLCAGSRSRLVAGDWSLCVAGNKGKARSGKFGVSVTGTSGHSVAGDDALAIVSEAGTAVAGAGGTAIGNGVARIAVGKGGVAIGTEQSMYRGDDDALFIVRTGSLEPGAFVVRVGDSGVDAGTWYRYRNGAMVAVEEAR